METLTYDKSPEDYDPREPEAKYSRWQTLEQAVNSTYLAQYRR